MSATVVILGCGRSGTSIFGELFEHLPGYRYVFEPDFDELTPALFAGGPVAIKVPKRRHGAPMTAGLPFQLEEFLAQVPQPRVLFWQVRHPLDAICSLRPGITDGWSHNPRPADWVEWLDKPVVMQCARHWQNINDTGYAALRHLVRVTRYEDLVAAPESFAGEIVNAIAANPHDCAKGIARWVELVGNRKSPNAYEAKHQERWSRQDHSIRVERWRENLSDTELDMVCPIVWPAAERFGYAMPDRGRAIPQMTSRNPRAASRDGSGAAAMAARTH